jgi:hypothetical protein
MNFSLSRQTLLLRVVYLYFNLWAPASFQHLGSCEIIYFTLWYLSILAFYMTLRPADSLKPWIFNSVPTIQSISPHSRTAVLRSYLMDQNLLSSCFTLWIRKSEIRVTLCIYLMKQVPRPYYGYYESLKKLTIIYSMILYSWNQSEPRFGTLSFCQMDCNNSKWASACLHIIHFFTLTLVLYIHTLLH